MALASSERIKRAIDACEYERDNYEALAGAEWQKILGAAVPVTVS
jgi:hypothetical protein